MNGQVRTILDMLARWAPKKEEAIPNDTLWLSEFRYQTDLLRHLSGWPEPGVEISHRLCGSVVVRLYRPSEGRLPLLLHMHGGGGVAGSVAGHDVPLRALAKATGCLVAAPLYRLAPEHRFPAQLDDGWEALRYLVMDSGALGVDRHRIVISGDSIGATLATTLARWTSHRDGPRIAGQILLYPNTDLRAEADYSSRRSEDGNIISADDLARQIDLYLVTPRQREHPDASPILADDLRGAPPALIVTCGADPLRDEGEAYARRLIDAGVAVRHHRYDGMIHAFMQMGGCFDATANLFEQIAQWLRQS